MTIFLDNPLSHGISVQQLIVIQSLGKKQVTD